MCPYAITVAIRKYNKQATDLQSVICPKARRLYGEWNKSRLWNKLDIVLILLIIKYLILDKLLNLFKPISLLKNGFMDLMVPTA